MGESFKQFEWPDDYYIWLCDMIDIDTHSGYSDLISFLYNTEFTWSVAKDVNRAQDGKDLRQDYICEFYYDEGRWMEEPCSWLEMFIALARRIRVDLMPDYDLEIEDWFWQILELWDLKPGKNCHFTGQKFENLGKKVAKNDFFDQDIWSKVQAFLAKKYDF